MLRMSSPVILRTELELFSPFIYYFRLLFCTLQRVTLVFLVTYVIYCMYMHFQLDRLLVFDAFVRFLLERKWYVRICVEYFYLPR